MKAKKFGRWFRMYDEVIDDPKIQTLSDKLGFFWMNCMCLASRNGGYLPPVDQIAWKLHKTVQQVASMVASLHDHGLLEAEGDTFAPHNWDARQFSSDVSTERVRRFRARNAPTDETVSGRFTKRHETAPETPPETETETEEKQKQKRDPQPDVSDEVEMASRRMRQLHPKSSSERLVVEGLLKIAIAGNGLSEVERCHAEWCRTEGWTEKDGKFAPKLQEWIADEGYLKWPKNGNHVAAIPPVDRSKIVPYDPFKFLRESESK